MKVLVVEDSQERIDKFQKAFEEDGSKALFCRNAWEAIQELSFNDKFDMVFLDHDLEHVNSGYNAFNGNGCDVAHFIAQNFGQQDHPKRPTRIVIHSMNPVGAQNIFDKLEPAGFNVIKKPFSVLFGD